ncbi:MAG: hypothetical protein VCA38_10785 [Roseibacillus sp.]
MKKKLLQNCLRVTGGMVLLAVLGVGVLSWMARKYVSKDGLVRMAEGQINSRVHIGEAKLSLFRFPARITLTDVALAPRDGEVGKALSEREPMVFEAAPVRVREVRLAVSLGALLQQRVEIKEFVFKEPHLAITLHEEGGNSLDDLLKSPGGMKKGKKTGEGGAAGGGKRSDDHEPLNTESLNIYAHGFLARLKNVRLEEASLDLVVEKTGMVIKVRDFSARLDQIDLDPSAIEKTNTARVRLEARVEIDAVEKDIRYAEIQLSGPAEAKLFDPVSGDLDLDIRGEFKLGEGSYLNARMPVVQKGWEALQKLDTIGIKIGDLPERATFGRSKSVAVHYHEERFTLLNPISLWFKDWEVALLVGTWVQTEKAEHQANVEVIADEKLSTKLRGQVGKGMDYLPSSLRPILVEEVEATWFRDGRLLAEIKTKGELSSPSIDVRNKFPDVKAMVRKAGEKLLKGKAEDFLKGVLGD